MTKEKLTIVDDRTNLTYTLPIENGAIRAVDLRKIKTAPDDFGLMSYDPAFLNTASCQSKVTFIDGERGILRYRGYDIEELAENCTFLQVAYFARPLGHRARSRMRHALPSIDSARLIRCANSRNGIQSAGQGRATAVETAAIFWPRERVCAGWPKAGGCSRASNIQAAERPKQEGSS